MRISDWSSDVCSSDLTGKRPFGMAKKVRFEKSFRHRAAVDRHKRPIGLRRTFVQQMGNAFLAHAGLAMDQHVRITIGIRRSEESRVGKECGSKCRSRWAA